jgi:hypothetical protein
MATGFAKKQVPGAGRGLVAIRDIPYGTDVLRERPMLAVPAERFAGKVRGLMATCALRLRGCCDMRTTMYSMLMCCPV